MMLAAVTQIVVILLALDRPAFLQKIVSLTTTASTIATPLHSLAFERYSSSPELDKHPNPPIDLEQSNGIVVKFPVETCTGGSFCVRIRVLGSKGSVRVYRAAVDTGSPYLVLSGDRDILYDSTKPAASKSRSKRQPPPFQLMDSSYPPTEEIYGSESGFLVWKQARISYRSVPPLPSLGDFVLLAMMDDQLEVEAGGTLLGLVKHPNPPRQMEFYRPTFLQQFSFPDGSSVRSFSIDSECLTLSNASLLQTNIPQIPLLDLRPLGAFIEHYCFSVQELNLDGVSVTSSKLSGRPIVAVLDTGLTGCLMTQEFWDVLTQDLSIDPRKVRLAKVRTNDPSNQRVLEFVSGRGFNNMFYVAPIYLDWFLDEQNAPYVVVLGQTFLSQGKLTVDIEDRLATFVL